MKTVLPTNSHQNIMLNEQTPVEVTFITNPKVDVPMEGKHLVQDRPHAPFQYVAAGFHVCRGSIDVVT